MRLRRRGKHVKLFFEGSDSLLLASFFKSSYSYSSIIKLFTTMHVPFMYPADEGTIQPSYIIRLSAITYTLTAVRLRLPKHMVVAFLLSLSVTPV
jgi:hypothetical protein